MCSQVDVVEVRRSPEFKVSLDASAVFDGPKELSSGQLKALKEQLNCAKSLLRDGIAFLENQLVMVDKLAQMN
ncbi:MAG: hypothetical protein AAB730_00900 [Patescibacteria group bacterium]